MESFETSPVCVTGVENLIRLMVNIWNDLSYEGDMGECDFEYGTQENEFRVVFIETDGEGPEDTWLDSVVNSFKRSQSGYETYDGFQWSIEQFERDIKQLRHIRFS